MTSTHKDNDFYQRLLNETAKERADMLSIPFIQQGAAGVLAKESYIAFLTQAYHHVKHTIPLLMACGGRLPARLEWLRTALGEYIEEEMGHQEWILNDINACGVDAEVVRSATPQHATNMMVAYAYHTIDRGNPVGFFGMVLVLEGTSIALATQAATSIQKTLALPDSAFSYLTSHGNLDIAHVDFFRQLMNKLTDSNDKQTIINAAKVFYLLYGDIFRTLPVVSHDE
ncbi:MAG: iron-containing redox enzyme family protein [Mariprofundales bacterium]